MMTTAVLQCQTAEAIASRALDLLVDGLRAGVHIRGQAHLALTGGSTAGDLFARLRQDERARRVDWSAVHVWQGDERFVPGGHPDRNWDVALAGWLGTDGGVQATLHPVPIDTAIEGGHDAGWAAARYAEELDAQLPRRRGTPAFDVILLGVGSDGHILSTFPGSDAIDERERAAMAVPAPAHIGPHVARITLTPRLLRAAGLVIVMVPGAAKAGIIVDCLGPRRDPTTWPAQLAIRPNAVWLLEPESSKGLVVTGGSRAS